MSGNVGFKCKQFDAEKLYLELQYQTAAQLRIESSVIMENWHDFWNCFLNLLFQDSFKLKEKLQEK